MPCLRLQSPSAPACWHPVGHGEKARLEARLCSEWMSECLQAPCLQQAGEPNIPLVRSLLHSAQPLPACRLACLPAVVAAYGHGQRLSLLPLSAARCSLAATHRTSCCLLLRCGQGRGSAMLQLAAASRSGLVCHLTPMPGGLHASTTLGGLPSASRSSSAATSLTLLPHAGCITPALDSVLPQRPHALSDACQVQDEWPLHTNGCL